MDHFQRIYRQEAERYHALIAAEDADGRLLPTLQAITPLAGLRLLDLGSGSGRIPLLLQGLDVEIIASDLHRAMLRQQARQRELVRGDWALVQADLRALPLPVGWADVVTAGWAIGHFAAWYADDWHAQVDRALAAMQRAARPGGTLIILETMGTGTEAAGPPNQDLAAYYDYLEQQGFERNVISTDYEFASLEEAVELSRFFFGEDLAACVQARRWQRLPEWTGIWSKRKG